MPTDYLPHAILILFGLLYASYGFIFLKRLLVALGAVGGMTAGLALANWLGSGDATRWTIALIGAGVGAVLLLTVYTVGLFAIGACTGLFVSPVILPTVREHLEFLPRLVVIIVSSLILGYISMKIRGVVLIVFAAVVGAFVVVVPIELLLIHEPTISVHTLYDGYTDAVDRRWWLLAAIAAAGCLWQLRSKFRRKPATPVQAEPAK